MKIHKNSNEDYNFEEKLQPLFDAMVAGKRIKEINFITRVAIKRNHITNFLASDYFVCMQENGSGTERFDYVISDENHTDVFYMNWVESFKL